MLTSTPKLLKRRRAKIVATLGPASADAATVAQLIAAGVDVFRLNMSHGDHASHAAAYRLVRDEAAVAGTSVAVMADLCGPKIRVGRFPGGPISLVPGARVTITSRPVPGEPGLIPSEYEPLPREVRPGSRILLADGLLELVVDAVDGTEVSCTVRVGGALSDRKGMNLPDVALSAPSLTDKDRRDAAAAVAMGVDFLALSFVRSAADVKELRALLPPDCDVGIISKIERPEALDDIEAIVDASDAIMVARGDLGVELPPERVPVIQRQLLAMARSRSKPSIVATQMLESMVDHPLPTRAEVSDVSTAVFSGADAVMLSAETAAGRYPVQAVEMMDRITRQVEGQLWTENGFAFEREQSGEPFLLREAVGRSTAQLSRDLMVRSIVVLSPGGTTARIMSSARPAAPLVAATTLLSRQRQMNLLWGVVPQLVDQVDIERPHHIAPILATRLGLAEPGHNILAVTGLGDQSRQPPSITILTV
jgi:pyruvate kinase